MRLVQCALGLACIAYGVVATSAEWILKSNVTHVDAGQPIDVEVLLLNDATYAIVGMLPDQLPVNIIVTDRELAGELRLVNPDDAPKTPLEPGAYRRAHYTLTLPPDVEGPVVVSLSAVKSNPLTLVAQRIAPIAGAPIPAPKPPAPPTDRTGLDTRPEPALQTHEPMYFIVGRRHDTTTAKFQLSFKYRLLDERGPITKFLPPLAKLHFAYTQTSLWDLSGDSQPFEDTSYKPSFFYLEPAAWTSADGRHNLAFEGGYEHESNGQGPEESRSVNILYIRPAWRTFLDDRHYVFVAPKIWYYLQDYADFQIQRYRGYFDLNLRLGTVDGLQLSTNYRKGTTTMGSVQVDVTYPLRRPFFADAGGYIMFQYFNGYGETLLDYNVKGPAQYRLGFAIVR